MWIIANKVGFYEGNPVLSPVEKGMLDEHLNSLLHSIAKCSDACEAEGLLYELGNFQGSLYKAWFGYGVALPPRCKELMRQYDRWDVPSIRSDFFYQVKNGKFCANNNAGKFQEEVLFIGETTILYTCEEWGIEIHIAKYPEGIVLDADTIKSWLPPHQEKMISAAEKIEIQKRVSNCLDRKYITHGWI